MSDPTKDITISVKLHTDWIERLDKLAITANLSRHQLIKNIITNELVAFKTPNYPIYFKIGLAIRDLQNRIGIKSTWKSHGAEKSIPVTLSIDECKKIEYIAMTADLMRSQFMRNLIYIGIEELEFFSKSKLFILNQAFSHLSTTLSKIIETGIAAHKAIK